MQNIYFLTFYTEGEEIDGGFNLTNTANKIKENLSPYFKEMFFFNKRTLKELPGSEEVCNSYEEALETNPNANHIGYFDFKAFLIKHVMNLIPEGSILMYHDGNFIKNSQYWKSDWTNIESICEKLMNDNNSDIFVSIEREGLKVKEYVKSYTIDKIFPDPIQNKLCREANLINAARIILRKSEFSQKFINDYFDLCMDKTLIAKNPNPNPDPDFKWSCGDQDVLNCLIYKYIFNKELPSHFPMYTFLYRILRLDYGAWDWEWDPEGRPGQSRMHDWGMSKIINYDIVNYINNTST